MALVVIIFTMALLNLTWHFKLAATLRIISTVASLNLLFILMLKPKVVATSTEVPTLIRCTHKVMSK